MTDVTPADALARDAITSLAAQVEQLRGACNGAFAWLANFSDHAPSCKRVVADGASRSGLLKDYGGRYGDCTCGLDDLHRHLCHAVDGRDKEHGSSTLSPPEAGRMTDSLAAQVEALTAQIDALHEVVLWALGERDSIQWWDDHGDPERRPGDGKTPLIGYFWWRTELRRRYEVAQLARPNTNRGTP